MTIGWLLSYKKPRPLSSLTYPETSPTYVRRRLTPALLPRRRHTNINNKRNNVHDNPIPHYYFGNHGHKLFHGNRHDLEFMFGIAPSCAVICQVYIILCKLYNCKTHYISLHTNIAPSCAVILPALYIFVNFIYYFVKRII